MALTQLYASSLIADSSGNDGLTPATALSIADALGAGSAGNVVNLIADGTYTAAADITLPTGTSTSPFVLRGYYGALGDCSIGGAQYSRANNNTGARVTTNMPLLAFDAGFHLNMAAFNILDGVRVTGTFTGATNSGGLIVHSSNSAIRSCAVSNASNNASASAVSGFVVVKAEIFDCDLALTAGSGGVGVVQVTSGAALSVISNRIQSAGSAPGVTMTTGTPVIISNTIFKCTHGINTTGTTAGPEIYGNTIANNVNDGINIVTGTSTLQRIAMNMITDNGTGGTGYGINAVSAANAVLDQINRIVRNATGAVNSGTDWLAMAIGRNTTAGSDYVNMANDDYRLRSTSPGIGAGPGGSDLGAGKGNVGARGSMGLGL